MAISAVEICNLALSRVRADIIASLDELSPAAEKCAIFYPQARDTVLTGFDWSFARGQRVLSISTFDPLGWEYAFDYPSDCLDIRVLLPLDESGETLSSLQIDHLDTLPIEYNIGLSDDNQKLIFCNYERVAALYTRAITDSRLWSSLVDELIAWKLAIDLAIPLGGDAGIKYRDAAVKGYASLEGQAAAKIGNERWPRLKQQRARSIQARGEAILSRDELIYRRGY